MLSGSLASSCHCAIRTASSQRELLDQQVRGVLASGRTVVRTILRGPLLDSGSLVHLPARDQCRECDVIERGIGMNVSQKKHTLRLWSLVRRSTGLSLAVLV